MAEYKDMTGYRELFDEEYKKTKKLILQGETHLDNLAEGFTEADMVIRKIPTADVVEVVRCKGCIYFEKDDDFDALGLCKCEKIATNYGGEIYPTEDYFCSYGERKDGGNDE